VSGREVHLIQRQPTLKANIRAQKREQFSKASQEKPSELCSEQTHFDSRVQVPAAVRPKKSFRFFDQGMFEHLGQKLRTKARLEALQQQIGQVAKKTGISSAARLALLNSIETKEEERTDEVPDIEWWDTLVLTKDTYDESLSAIDRPEDELFEGITHLVEHPMQMRPPGEPISEVTLPVFLTKKEQKKLRRQNRREAWKEKQEKIRLGLDPPPEPKVKMSNMMRVLGSQAVQDPTKVEAHVREQVARRQREHEQTNAARKLTDDQKREKKLKKVQEDTSLGVNVSLYRLLSLMNPAKKFKVETNARQLTMTGIAVLFKNVNVIVVEGGPKQQKKFKQLMLNRVKWSEEQVTIDTDGTGGVEQPNACHLVWQGVTKTRSFGEFKIKISPNESFAKELFKNHNVPHYWDLAYSSAILESSDT
jgi:U4/U6 small nuclear ribonucleoprotein PRP3